MADRLYAGGEPRMAEIIRAVCRSNDSYRVTLQTLHRDNMALRERIRVLEGGDGG